MTLAALSATWALYRAWWAKRPSLTHSQDYTSPKAIERGRVVPAIAMPARIQVLWLKLPRAPRGALEDLLSEMESIERGWPAGGGSVILSVTRATDGLRDWRWARTEAEPPGRRLTAVSRQAYPPR